MTKPERIFTLTSYVVGSVNLGAGLALVSGLNIGFGILAIAMGWYTPRWIEEQKSNGR
jgi:hypothetical protein